KCTVASTAKLSTSTRQSDQKPSTAKPEATAGASGRPSAAAYSASCTAKNSAYTPHSPATAIWPVRAGSRGARPSNSYAFCSVTGGVCRRSAPPARPNSQALTGKEKQNQKTCLKASSQKAWPKAGQWKKRLHLSSSAAKL